MKTISVVAQKGGCGKTSLTFHLAGCAIKDGLKVAIIDLDPQGSSFGLWEERENKTRFVAVQANEKKLAGFLKKAKKSGIDLVLVDTPGHSNSTATSAVKLSNFVLVPCRLAKIDLKSVASTLGIVRLAKKRYGVVINHAPMGNLARDVVELFEVKKTSVFKAIIRRRIAVEYAMNASLFIHEYEPEGKAALEIAQLYKSIKNMVKFGI